jgi:hypothetical protein
MVTVLRVGICASGTSRRSASLDVTVVFMTSVVCIVLPINRADDLSADKLVVGFSGACQNAVPVYFRHEQLRNVMLLLPSVMRRRRPHRYRLVLIGPFRGVGRRRRGGSLPRDFDVALSNTDRTLAARSPNRRMRGVQCRSRRAWYRHRGISRRRTARTIEIES